MAPGAKKRKAAKKKKHNHNHNHNNNNNHTTSTHDNEEHRSQDEKDSDGAEVTSPASRDHDVQTHPFDEGSEKVDPSTDQSPIAENESIEEVASKEEPMDDYTAKMKSEEDVEIKEVIIEYVEPAKELSGNGEISNISSLDYASQVNEEKFVEKEINSESYVDETKPTEGVITTVTELDNVIAKPGSVVDEVKSAVPEEAVEFIESVSVENSVVCDESGLSFKENSEKPLPTTDENIEILQQAENVLASENNKHNVSRVSDEGVLTMPDASSAITDVALKEIKDKNLPILEENVRVSSTLSESAMSANESTAFTSSEGSSAVTSSGTENIKDSETKPLIAPTPAQQVVRKTSWLNCCGIFDVLTGSSR